MAVTRSSAGAVIPPLGTDDCQVWWARLGHYVPWMLELLDPAERQRRGRYLNAADSDRFTLGVAMTRLVLAARLGTAPADVAIDRSCGHCGEPHGRPRLADARAAVDLSVSHSGDLVALAVTPGAPDGGASGRSVGVDVERLVPLREPPERLVLSAAERVAFGGFDAAAQPTAFFRYWVRKEAVLKATGDGLMVPLTRLTVSGPDQPARLREWAGRASFAATVSLHDLDVAPGYAASLALLGRDAELVQLDAAALLTRLCNALPKEAVRMPETPSTGKALARCARASGRPR